MATRAKRVDVVVENHGSIFIFQPLSKVARTWIADHVYTEPWQWLGEGLAVDHHYAQDLAQGKIRDGLQLR